MGILGTVLTVLELIELLDVTIFETLRFSCSIRKTRIPAVLKNR
jgi:hypothetical protein